MPVLGLCLKVKLPFLLNTQSEINNCSSGLVSPAPSHNLFCPVCPDL